MVIGIIGALDEEVELFHRVLKDSVKREKAGLIFYSGKFLGKEVVIVKSGPGKVNASMTTQILVSEFNVHKVIFTGVAGALNPDLNVLDVVISEDCVQHDVDATPLGIKKGQILFSELRFFKSCEILKEKALNCARKLGFRAISGRVLTGDQFITDAEKSKSLQKEFEGDCVDMEGAAVAQVCHLNVIPHVIIRTISDKADHAADADFKEFLHKAARNSFLIVEGMISQKD
jgi:adenosylhomocysteine nucleosidase